jgi:hypothetical protein
MPGHSLKQGSKGALAFVMVTPNRYAVLGDMH